jgi:hypothetical protein
MSVQGYIVDSRYPNRIGYLAPFKGTTYHLLDVVFDINVYLKGSLRYSVYYIRPCTMLLSMHGS